MSDFLGSLLNEKAPSVDTKTDFLGGLITPEKAEKRNAFAVANDTVITGANAVLGGVQAVSDFVSPGNQFSQGVEALIKEGEEKQSTAVKQGRAKLSSALESEDIGTQLRGVKNYVLENPLQAAAMAAGSFAPIGGVIGGAKLAAGALGLGAKAAGRTALGAGSLASGAMSGGDAAGSAYQEVMNAPSLSGLPVEERERIASDAARKASAVPFVLGAASGLFGAEKALATGTKSILKTAGTEFVSEAIEEGGTQLSSNIAAAQAGADVGTWKGVAGSAALGGALGGGTGLAVGALQKQPDSLLQGSTNISTGNASPDSNAIDKAIDSNSSEIGNTGAQAIFAEQRATELRQQADETQAKLQEVQVAQQQQAQQQADAQAAQEFKQKASMYGIKPLDVANQYRIGNKQFFNTNQAAQFIQGMEELNQGLGDEVKFLLGAAVDSGALKIDQKATPKTVHNAAVKFLANYGLADSVGVDDAVGRVESIIGKLEGPKALKEADVLNNFYKSITGNNSPAFDALMSAVNQQEGVSDGQLQLQQQGNAGLRTVSEQGGATQTGGEGTGNVRPTSVQPVGTAGIGAGSLGLQTGAIPSGGVPTGAGTNVSGATLPSGSAQETQVNEQPTENAPAVGGGNAPIAASAGGAGPLNLNGRNPEELQRLIKKSAGLWYELDKSGLDPQQLAPTLQAMWVEAVANNRADADYAAYLVAENTPENVTYRTALTDIMSQLLRQDRAAKKVRLTDEKLAKKVLVMQEYFGDSLKNRGQQINDVADYFDITPDQVRAWTKEAQEFPTARIKEIKALVPEVAKRYGQTEEEFWAGFAKAIEDNKRRLADVSAAAQAKEETTKTELELAKKDEEGNVTSAASTTNRVTGISVNDRAERGEKASTNFIKLANQRIKAQKAGDTAKIEEIDAQIEELKKLAAKSIKSAAAKAKSAGKEEKILTTAEKAEQIWNTRAEKLPSLNIPAYSKLPKAAQEDWKDAVEGGNTKAADMNAIYERYKNQFQKTETVEAQPLTKEQQKVIDSLDYNVQIESDGKMYDAAYMSLEDMLKFDGIASAFRDLATSKIAKALKTVDAFVVFKNLDADGIMTLDFSNENKERNTFVGISEKLLKSGDARRLSHVINHEIGHAVDDPGTLGVYSSQPEFNVRVKKDGTIDQSFSGSVMRELYSLFQSDENFKFLGYPFNDKQAMKSSHVVRGEVFAQMFSAMANAPTREMIKQRAPVAYDFFKDVFNDIETTAFQTSTEKFRTAEEKNIETENRSVRFADNRGQERTSAKNLRGKQEVTFYSKPAPEVVKNNIKKLPPVLRGPVAAITDALFNAKETTLGVMITADVEDAARKYMGEAVDDYVAARQERERIESAYTERLDKILIDAQEKLNEGQRNTLNRLIEDSTLSGKWAYDPGIEGVTMQLDPGLESRFKAMPPAAQKVAKDIFGYFRDVLRDKQTAIKNQVDRVFEERVAAAEGPEEKAKLEKDKKRMLDKFSSIMTQSALSPYAPIKRHGPFVVVAKSKKYMDAVESNDKKLIDELQSDANEYVVEFAETMSEAHKMYDELQKRGYDSVEEPFKKNDYKESMFGGVDLYKGFAKLKQLIANEKGAADLEESKKLFSQMETLVNDMYLTSLAENSARKSEMQRKKIAGFNRAVSGEASRDMLRAAFSQGAADAKFIANIQTSDASIDALAAMQEEAKKNRAQAHPYLNELMAREAQSLEFRPRSILDLANRMTGDWFLTFSPGFYFQQSMQSYVLSLPWLAARFGYAKSAGKLTDSYKAVMPLVKGTGLREHLDFSKAPSDVRDMLQKLASIGAINIGIETELYKYRSIEDNKAISTYNNVTTKLRGIINRIEALNRSAAAVTAYRLEMADSGSKDKAYEAAYRIVKDTHGLYDGSNTPRLFNKNAVTRSVTQFKRFQVIQLTTLYGLARDAFKSSNPTEKAIARKQLMFMLGHSFALGGVKGLPIAGLLGIAYTLGKMAFGDDDDPEDFEAFLRSQGGVLLAKGIPAYMGVDTSKLSMGNVTSLLPYTNVDLTSRTGVEKVLSGLAGPFVGGLLPKVADGLGLMSKGDYYKGLEQILPTGIAGAMKGYRYATEGVTTRSGDLLISPDDISLSDSLLQAMGMPSAIITERQYLQGEVSKYDKFYNERTRELKSQYTRAYKEGDSELLSEIRDDWKKLQESRKENGYTIQPLSVLLKAPQEQKKREKAVIGGVAGTKANKGFIQQRTGE